MPRNWPLVLLVVSLALVTGRSQNTSSVMEGGITGVVLAEDGQLAKGAKVCTAVHHGSNTHATCSESTDEEGRFTVKHLKAGNYEVFAINEAEGYSKENQTPGQDVTISADQLWPNVTIHQHSKGGVLVGSVIDKLTGRNISKAELQYTAIDRNCGGGSEFIQGSVHQSNFQVTVPANCDLLLVVMADGYRGLVYTDPANPSRPVVRLGSGEKKALEIQLEPLPANSSPQ